MSSRLRCSLWAGLSLALSLSCLADGSARVDPAAVLSERDRLYDVARAGDLLYVVGHPGHLLRSRDAGQSFTVVRAGQGTHALFSVDFNAHGQGAVVGRAGTLLTTTDSGTSWRYQALEVEGEQPNLFAVAVLPSGEIVAVGELGLILRSDDGGRSFRRVPYELLDTDRTPTECPDLDRTGYNGQEVLREARLTDVAFRDGSHGFVAGEFGLLLETRDGGRTFTQRATCTARTLYGLNVEGEGPWLAVGFDGTLLERAGEGEAWRSRSTPTESDLYAATRFGDRHLIVGARGTLMLRGPGGELERLPAGVHTWLVAASLEPDGVGVAVGGRAHLLRTLNGGRNWQAVLGSER